MARPNDITEAAWDEAAALRSAVVWQTNAANEIIARALMAAEARGRAQGGARERERCTEIAAQYGEWGEPMRDASQFAAARVAAGEIAAAIRKHGEAV